MSIRDQATARAGARASARVCVGEIVAAHGVRGAVKVRSFTADPKDVTAYGPLTDEQGRQRFELVVAGTTKGGLICHLPGVGDRDAAAGLRGTRLYVARAALPAPADEDEFYHADLIGARVESRTGALLGRVRGVYDFGAGDVLDVVVADGGRSIILPFTKAAVPEVDLARGRLIALPPAGLFDEVDTTEDGLRERGPKAG